MKFIPLIAAKAPEGEIDLEEDFDPNDEKNYPAMGTPNTALLAVLDNETYKVLDHKGRFFHAQLNCAGVDGIEVGIDGVPDEPGFYVFYDGTPWTTKDWESGHVDDYGIEGKFRKARPEDFEAAGLDCPLDLSPTVDPAIAHSLPQGCPGCGELKCCGGCAHG